MSAIIIIVVSIILVVVFLIALILLLQRRKGKKSAVDSGTNDWQSQPQQGAWNQQSPGGWGQQQPGGWGAAGASTSTSPWAAQNDSQANPWATQQRATGQFQQPAANPPGNQGVPSPPASEPEAQDLWIERSVNSGTNFATALPPPTSGYPPALQGQYSYAGNDNTVASFAEEQGLAGRDLAHEYIQFTAFYSRVVPTMTWNTLLVYAHIEAALQAVREDALKFKEEIGSFAGEASAWATLPMTRGTQITVVPTCQGIRFNPERFVFTWIEDWHQIKFRFQVDQRLANIVGNGEITTYAGPLIIGSLKISMRFVQQSLVPHIEKRRNFVETSASLYKHIFTSYSHQDTPVVLACRNAYKALGFESLIDIDTLRSGQRWNTELMRMIDTADLFQLFWSAGAAQSTYVRQEWQYALQRMPEESFIRPVYWEKPLVPPPAELKHLHFAYIELPRLEIPEETQKLAPRALLPARMRVERGKEPGCIYEIRKDAFSIGRSRESDLFLEDLQVSRLHASVLKTNGGIYVLRDEGSANGTKLNEQPMNKFQMFPLAEGDRIQIGETVLVFLKGNIF